MQERQRRLRPSAKETGLDNLSPGTGNRILHLLPEEDRERIERAGRRRRFEVGEVLHESAVEIREVVFPLSGVLSLLAVLSTGEAVEAATVGREGMVGLPVFLGSRIASTRTVVQVPGEAVFLPSPAFRRELGRNEGSLALIMARYAELMFISAAQAVACNRIHSLSQRLARAILTWHDRLGTPELPVTQDAVADALGVRRAGVTQAVSEFVAEGAIQRGRGKIIIDNRRVLEERTCECYVAVREAYERPIG